MTFLKIEVLDGHKAAFIFEDAANATSHFGESLEQASPVKMMCYQKLGSEATPALSQERCG